MANPQTGNGFIKIANELWDAMKKYRFPSEEMSCLIVVFSKTDGWNKPKANISLSCFVKETGMAKPSVCRALKSLKNKNIIIVTKKGKTTEYQLQKNYETWQPLTKKLTTKKQKSLTNSLTTIEKKQKARLTNSLIKINEVVNLPHESLTNSLIPLLSNKDTLKDKDILQRNTVNSKKRVDVTHKKPNNHELIVYEKNKKAQDTNILSLVLNFIEYTTTTFNSNAPKKTQSLIDSSYDTIDKLIRIDMFSFEYLCNVLRWSCKDDFWNRQILSLSGLRKKSKNGMTKFQNVANAYSKEVQTTGIPELDKKVEDGIFSADTAANVHNLSNWSSK